MILTAGEVVKTPDSTIPPEVTLVIEEFSDVFPKTFRIGYHRCVTSNAIFLVPDFHELYAELKDGTT